MSNATSSSERYAEAQKALAAWDDQTIDITGDDGYIIRGTITRAEWVIKKLRTLVEAPTTTEMPDEIAGALSSEYVGSRDEVILARSDFQAVLVEAVQAGIHAAWESWEPEGMPQDPDTVMEIADALNSESSDAEHDVLVTLALDSFGLEQDDDDNWVIAPR